MPKLKPQPLNLKDVRFSVVTSNADPNMGLHSGTTPAREAKRRQEKQLEEEQKNAALQRESEAQDS